MEESAAAVVAIVTSFIETNGGTLETNEDTPPKRSLAAVAMILYIADLSDPASKKHVDAQGVLSSYAKP